MQLQSAGFPAYRVVGYRYMTYDELAAALRSTPSRASELAVSNGWNSPTDQVGRARFSVPESFIRSQVCLPVEVAGSETAVSR